MATHAAEKVVSKSFDGQGSGYKPSAPPNYQPPAPIRVPPLVKQAK